MTCNYVTKIITPLKSRLIDFEMNYSEVSIREEMEPKINARIKKILEFKKIEFQDEIVEKLVAVNYTDM